MAAHLSSDPVDALVNRSLSFHQTLNTNNPPPYDDIAGLRSLLHDAEFLRESRFLGNGVIVDTLNLHDLDNLIFACRSSLSSFRRIPPEILSYIFSLALPQFSTLPASNSLDVNSFPWAFGHICRNWRSVALSSSELWSCISLDTNSLYWINGIPKPAVLEIHLRRSQNHPLSIYFLATYDRPARVPRLFDLLLSESHRWEHASLNISFDLLDQTRQIRGRVPMLERLEIKAYGANIYGTFDSFSVAPALREVSLDIGDPFTISLPWTQITSIEGVFDTPESALKIFGSVPILETFTAHLMSEDLRAAPVITHPTLRKLYINAPHSIRRLVLPRLEELVTCSPVIGVPDVTADLTVFLRNASCSLMRLQLVQYWAGYEGHMETILPYISDLRDLSVDFASSGEEVSKFLHQLTVTDTSVPLPNLRRVEFHFNHLSISGLAPTEVQSLTNMVKSHWYVENHDNLAQLVSVHIGGGTSIRAVLEGELQGLSSAGLNIYWS